MPSIMKKKGRISSSKLLRPTTPFEQRMIKFGWLHQVPPFGTPEAAQLQKLMAMDVAFQLELKELQKRLPLLLNARLKNGSGLQLAKLLRSFVLEYFNRYFRFGPNSFPSSFNVLESFLTFDRENRFFNLRKENEHLLSINDYFRWYEKGEIPKDPRILASLMEEGVIYSYEMISDESSLRISGESQQVFAGVSFVRHGLELSCLLLAGEKPPAVSDEDVSKMNIETGMFPGRKGLEPDPSLTTKDRYLDGYPDFSKIIVLTRFDLSAVKHGVRYVNVDIGSSFQVFTDDSSAFRDLPREKSEPLLQHAIEGLRRYDDLFAALSSMIYLPAFFAAFPQKVQELNVATELYAMQDDEKLRDTFKEFGESQCPKHRVIRCFPMAIGIKDDDSKKIDPPQLEFKCDGYWKPIGPLEIGEDKNGGQIFGRTWVSRHESWSARKPQTFILKRSNVEPNGPDPGILYIQRSPALENNLYKVGLTKRSAAIRANELSSATGVPLPFGVLASWSVGDCTRVEREVHQRLAASRINPRREFFHAELSHIIKTINDVVEEITAT